MPATSPGINVLSQGVAGTVISIQERNHVIQYIILREVYVTAVLIHAQLRQLTECNRSTGFSSEKISAKGRSGE